MIINYQNLPDEAKVFIYPSSRKFYPKELEGLEEKIKIFISNWTTYSTTFKIEYQRFLVFFIEDNIEISADMLNTLAQFILQLELDYSITLLDKINVCFKQGEYVQYQDMKRFRELIKKKSISKKTIVFDNLIHTKREFENHWEVPISESWLSHLIK